MRCKAVAALVALGAILPTTGHAVEFNFSPEPGMAQEAIDGFRAAGRLWSDLLTDDITVNVDIGFRSLSPGVLGETGSTRVTLSYGDLRTVMTTDTTSADDAAAVASLAPGPADTMLLNRTSNSPHGSGSAQPFLDDDGDDNNVTIRLTRANAKALGLILGTHPARDAAITFNSDFNWDFDPSDGIDPNSFSFIFVAAHEIGHALGFISGVDILDQNSPPQGGPFADHQFNYVSPVDVFRFSAQSFAQGAGILDWTADTRGKFFALDGGATGGAGFSTGRRFGDGRQASHWRDGLGLGIMDPTAAPGERGQITALDRQLFDVIGYQAVGAPPPQPPQPPQPPAPTPPAVVAIQLQLDPDAALKLGERAIARGTVTENGAPKAGTTISFATGDAAVATISPQSVQTNAAGIGEATVEGRFDGVNQTVVIAMADGVRAERPVTTAASPDEPANVPGWSPVAILVILLAIAAGVMVRARTSRNR